MSEQVMIELAQQLNTHAEMMARIAAMHAANHAREVQGLSHAYGEDEFFELTNELGCHHNARCMIGVF